MRALLPSVSSRPAVELEYETFGNAADAPLLLVAGFSQQLIMCDPRLCAACAAGVVHVVRFDNRDVGLSTKIEGGPRSDMAAILAGDRSTLNYGLEDMADDVAGLMDHLGIPSAHLVGVSMGGMITQTVALRHAARVRSFVSVMSTTGDPRVGYAAPETLALVMQRAPKERAAFIEHGVRVWH